MVNRRCLACHGTLMPCTATDTGIHIHDERTLMKLLGLAPREEDR